MRALKKDARALAPGDVIDCGPGRSVAVERVRQLQGVRPVPMAPGINATEVVTFNARTGVRRTELLRHGARVRVISEHT